MTSNVAPFDSAAAYDAVRDAVDAAARAADRSPQDIALVAVAKKHDRNRIAPVLAAGHRVFGENRVQEAAAKWPDLRAEYAGVELHLVGPLQTNKVRDAFDTFDVLHALDRAKLARAIAGEAEKRGRAPKLFIQINTGEEPQKSGALPTEADAFIAQCRNEFGLTIDGLMCIPPADEEPSLHFALLQKIAERNGVASLSMGMSADFETAIAFGATHVRIGSAIFGERPS